MTRETIGEQHGGRLYVRIGRGVRRVLKRIASKLRRRQERRDLENAPKVARYSGWAD